MTDLAGVISTSPLILQAKPAAKAARWIGGKASLLAPWITIPSDVKGQVLTTFLANMDGSRLTVFSQNLSHDKTVGEEYAKDPMVKQIGSLRGVSDMLDGVDNQSVFLFDVSPLVLRASISCIRITLVGPQTSL